MTKIYTKSGCNDIPKLSQKEMSRVLNSSPCHFDMEFETPPCYNACKVHPGVLNDRTLNRTLRQINILRQIAGVPNVSLDPAWIEMAQITACLEAIDYQSHRITRRPEHIPEQLFQIAADNARQCNLYKNTKLDVAPEGFVDDPGIINLPAMGHRRWQLSPGLNRIGIGYAVVNGKSCSTEKVFETSDNDDEEIDTYDFIAWPPSGNFPKIFINRHTNLTHTAWSVSLNPNRFQKPVRKNLRIKMKNDQYYELPGTGHYRKTTDKRYMTLNFKNYGGTPCIIFRPENITDYHDVFDIEISGLVTASGDDAIIRYKTRFF